MSDDWPHEYTEERMAVAAVAPKTEPELLAAIDHQDHATRIVYADWLEEQGDSERAEYVRLQDQLLELHDGLALVDLTERVRVLAGKLDAAWRVLVARPRIRNCKREGCPGEWGSLAPAHRSDVRVCGTCHTNVRYVVRTERLVHVHEDAIVDRTDEWPDDMTTGEWGRRTEDW